MRKSVPHHGNLDHCFLKQLWTNKPIPKAKPLYSIGTPEQFRAVMEVELAKIDAMLKYRPQTESRIKHYDPRT
jgi:hypothetical protein